MNSDIYTRSKIHFHLDSKYYPMKSKTILLVVSLFTYLLPVQAQETWDWNMCLDYAMQNNIRIKLNQINIALADIQQKQDKLAFTPSVNATAGYNTAVGRTVDLTTYQFVTKPVQTGNVQVSLNQPIFEGLRNFHSLHKSKLDFEAARLDHEALKEEVSLQVMNAYLNVLQSEEQLEQAKNQLIRTKEQYQINLNLVESGALAERMLVDLEAQLAAEEYNSVIIQQQVDLAYMALKTVLQLDQNKEIKIVSPNIPSELQIESLDPITDIYKDALEIRPEIKGGLSRISSAQKAIKIAKSAYYPTLSFFTAAQTNVSDQFTDRTFVDTVLTPIGFVSGSGEPVLTLLPETRIDKVPISNQFSNNFSFALGVNLSIPIYNKRSFYFNTQRSKLSLAQAELNQENLEFILLSNIKEAHLKAFGSTENYKAAVKNSRAAEKSFAFAEERAQNGAISQLEVNLAQSNLFIAKSRVIQAKYEYLFNLKVLDFYRGKDINFE